MIDYSELAPKAYEYALRRGRITEDATVAEILCDCMAELSDAWREWKKPVPLFFYTCAEWPENPRCAAVEVCCSDPAICGRSYPDGAAVPLADTVICLLALMHSESASFDLSFCFNHSPRDRDFAKNILTALEMLSNPDYSSEICVWYATIIFIHRWFDSMGTDFEAILLERLGCNTGGSE